MLLDNDQQTCTYCYERYGWVITESTRVYQSTNRQFQREFSLFCQARVGRVRLSSYVYVNFARTTVPNVDYALPFREAIAIFVGKYTLEGCHSGGEFRVCFIITWPREFICEKENENSAPCSYTSFTIVKLYLSPCGSKIPEEILRITETLLAINTACARCRLGYLFLPYFSRFGVSIHFAFHRINFVHASILFQFNKNIQCVTFIFI